MSPPARPVRSSGPELPRRSQPVRRLRAPPGVVGFARANGMTEAACIALAHEVASGFTVTPFAAQRSRLPRTGVGQGRDRQRRRQPQGPSPRRPPPPPPRRRGARARRTLAAAAGHLVVRQHGDRRRDAAQRSEWPIEVYVPDWARRPCATIEAIGAESSSASAAPTTHRDPAVLRFREAVAAGAVPFRCRVRERLCLDGGRTLGWELADAPAAGSLDRIAVQVGGGALAACIGWGLGPGVRLDTVQARAAPHSRGVVAGESPDTGAQVPTDGGS